MLTVRYPDGRVIVYNQAVKLTYTASNHSWELANSRGDWIASIQLSAGVIIEADSPCRITRDLGAVLEDITDNPEMLRLAPGRILAELKRQLQDFNRQTWCWKD